MAITTMALWPLPRWLFLGPSVLPQKLQSSTSCSCRGDQRGGQPTSQYRSVYRRKEICVIDPHLLRTHGSAPDACPPSSLLQGMLDGEEDFNQEESCLEY